MSRNSLLLENSEDLNEETSSVESYDEMTASRHFSVDVETNHSSRTLLKQPSKNVDTLMYMGYMGLGVANNGTYVIILAVAKKLSEGGVGLVYFVNIFPGLIAKLLFPYVAHYFSYNMRISFCTILMAFALFLVSVGGNLGIQLIGIAGIAIQSSLGEATALSMTSKVGGEFAISAWGCGTGLAGLFGYLWVFLFGDVVGLSVSQILLVSQSITVLYITSYIMINSANGNFPARKYFLATFCPTASNNDNETERVGANSLENLETPERQIQDGTEHSNSVLDEDSTKNVGALQTLKMLMSLWRIAFALFLVYFCEYTMMTGTWSSMGTHIHEESSRQEFYTYSNWCYQTGVWISRTWGILLPVTKPLHLWYMSFSQLFLLLFFLAVCYWRFWTGVSIYPLCIVAGLFGGATYVNAFALVSRMVPANIKERIIGGISVSDTFGIVMADIAGLFIQGCMYRHHSIPGGEFNCGA
eukprot:435231_1